MKSRSLLLSLLSILPALIAAPGVMAGPYSDAAFDTLHLFDAPVPGFIGPDGEGKARLYDGLDGFDNPRNFVNPIFFGWATTYSDYHRADNQSPFSDATLVLGPVTGDNFDVASLGDLTAMQLSAGTAPGRITVQFTDALQPQPIRNLPGADFVVFENGFISEHNTGGVGIGGIFAELAFVEVSSDGVNFARFPARSLTSAAVGGYGTVDATNIFGLAGKHVNAYGDSWGTPFDLSVLASHALVLSGTVNLNNIRHVRLVDIPGNGSVLDSAGQPIFDAWHTFGSGGLDLEAIGAISLPTTFARWQDVHALAGAQRGAQADPDRDGVPNAVEYACAMHPLIADVELLPSPALSAGVLSLSFRRDVRTVNATIEVQGAAQLTGPWEAVARSVNGADLAAVTPFAPVIQDASASVNASIGVIRKHSVTAAGSHRFLRLRVTISP